jgi:hypothetical protein
MLPPWSPSPPAPFVLFTRLHVATWEAHLSRPTRPAGPGGGCSGRCRGAEDEEHVQAWRHGPLKDTLVIMVKYSG